MTKDNGAAQAAGVSTSPEHLTPLPRHSDQNGQLNPLWETGHGEVTGLGRVRTQRGSGKARQGLSMWCLQVVHALSSRPKGNQKNVMDTKHRKERNSCSLQ